MPTGPTQIHDPTDPEQAHGPSSGAADRLVIGAMTGTSLDAIDASLVFISGRGSKMHARVIGSHTRPLGPLQTDLRGAAEGEPLPASAFADLALRLGRLYAETCAELREAAAGGRPIDLAGVHGQTLWHRPPVSLQLLEPAPIAAALGCPVWFNPRQADLADGGQGAPITPAADEILYGSPDEPRAVVNLGGFCNITLLDPSNGPAGFDLCACNQLLDGLARRLLSEPFDNDGATASLGTPDSAGVAAIAGKLKAQRAESRSLGSGDELAGDAARTLTHLSAPDALASACDALGSVIAAACDRQRVLLAGGGARNRALRGAIERHADGSVHNAGEYGPGGADRESACMAVLAALAADGHPITHSAVTSRVRTTAPDGCWAGVKRLDASH